MPDGVVIRVRLVFVKEIGTNSIKHTLRDDPCKSGVRHVKPHRVEYKQRHPTHRQIERQRQPRVPAEGDNLSYHARKHTSPEEDEQRPTYPTADDRQADERVRTRNHDVDRYMVEDPQPRFVRRIHDGVVERRREEHQQHAQQE